MSKNIQKLQIVILHQLYLKFKNVRGNVSLNQGIGVNSSGNLDIFILNSYIELQ